MLRNKKSCWEGYSPFPGLLSSKGTPTPHSQFLLPPPAPPVTRVLSDLLQAVDSGDVAALVLLDLSAAFDTVDHAILCRRLRLSFGLDGSALAWFQSYLRRRVHNTVTLTTRKFTAPPDIRP